MTTLTAFKQLPLKALCVALVTSFVLVGCGAGSNKRENSSPSSSSSSSAVSSTSSSSSSVADSSVSSADSSSTSSTPAQVNLSFSFEEGIEGWYVNGDGTNLLLEHDADAAALRITPIAWSDADNWLRQARVNLDPAVDMDGATVTMVINVPEAYITDAALVLQIVIQGDPAYGDSWTPVTGLVAGDNTVVWSPDGEDGTENITSLGLQLSTPPTDTTILDPILIKSILVELPSGTEPGSSSSSSESSESSESSAGAGVLTVNFDSDAVGTVYEKSSWEPEHLTATVVSIASVTGLPANGASTNVLKIVVSDYNAMPIFNITLPEGATLNDYDVMVDAYLPRNTLGLTDNDDNFYKPLLLAAGTEITSGVNNDNPAYHDSVETEGNVDTWTSFTLTVDTVKGAALSGTFKIGLGVSRPAGAGEASAYYFDNVRLVAK